jgi:RHS repeat-associated protein
LTAAGVAARLCGGRVEVLDMLSETTRTWVNPDGSLTSERYLGPVRIHRDGQWIPVDFTFVRTPDGGVASKAHPVGLRLSGAVGDGGEHELVTLGSGDSAVGVSWRGRLPEPVLEGSKATYRDVLPSVDVVVEATRTGYRQLFVVKDRAGLASVARIPVGMRTGKLSAASDGKGGITFKDGGGAVASRIASLEMWDSTVDPASGDPVRRAPVSAALTSRTAGVTDAVLTPDATFLARKDLVFPVMIDPDVQVGPSFDTFVQKNFTSDQSSSTELRIGTYNGGADVARSYLVFPTGGLAGTTVLSATLNLAEFHSWSCNAAGWEAYRSPEVGSGVRWTNQPAPFEAVGVSTKTTGYSSSCPDGWVDIAVTGAFQYAAANSQPTATVMLKATSETANGDWKKFYSANATGAAPYVMVTYNSAPGVPSNPTVAPCYSICGPGARVASTHPTLTAQLYDDSSWQMLKAEFEVRDAASTVAASGLLAGPGWASGSLASWQVPANLVDGTFYEWRLRAHDGLTYGNWSGWAGFTVDTTAPGVPFVSGSPYANDGQPHGGAGVAGTFTLTPPTGLTDLAAFVYTLSSPSATLVAQTTLPATAATTVSLTPSVDGNLTLSVMAKDRAGNQSAPNTYAFKVGAAALAQPLPGANVARRMKLSVDSAVSAYTRGYFEYRRGPGGAVLTVPPAYLTTAGGTPLAATSTSPAVLANLGGYAVWSATDTLGSVDGVVEVRAQLYTDSSPTPVFATPWVRVTVDRDADGAAGTSVGPGAVNLLTGDYGLSSTDTDDLGLTVGRTASSRRPTDGYQEQQELLNENERQITTDTSTFVWDGNNTTLARATDRGQGDSTDSLSVTTRAASTDTFAAIGADTGALRIGMRAGKHYRAQGWIFVPEATGLAGTNGRADRIVFFHRTGTGPYLEQTSTKAGVVNAWQEITLDFTVPAGATEAFIRVYNGNTTGTTVYWDNLSVKEIVAPFGPSWSGGATGGPAASDYTTLEFPQASLAQANLIGGGSVTFSRNTDGVSFTPEPGAEGLALSKPDANTYRITDIDGTVSDFTVQGATWTLASSRTTGTASTTRYVYDTSNFRNLLKKVINPVEPGVDDVNSCTGTPQPGCEVLEYVYATSTTPGLSQTVFGDYLDQVRQVKLWASDPATGVVSDTVVTEYRYDVDGELREVWDPRVPGPNLGLNKTATGSTACGTVEGPEKAVNGTYTGGSSDKWCSTTGPQWLQIDLGTSQTVTSVVIRHAAAGGESASWNTRDYTVQVSTNASTWTTVATVSANTDPVTTHQFAATTARYIKLNITTPTQNGDPAARIYELEVYGGPPPLKTTYNYGPGGRVTSVTPPGELPWQFVYGNPDVDDAAVRWDFDQDSGTTVTDTSGNGRDGTIANGTWVRGTSTEPSDNAVSFNGTSAAVTRAGGSGVATDASFTVSAWVNSTDPSTFRTAIAQDGTNISGFFLQQAAGKWSFTRQSTDSSTSATTRTWSTDLLIPGQWTHLTGIYDATAGQLRLYVNGALNSTVACSCAWNATGAFTVGRAKWNSINTDWWLGGIDDVRVYPKALTSDQVANLAGDENPGRLLRVQRAALQQGSPTTTDGTIASNVVYHVPLTVPTGGPYNLDAGTAGTWGQSDYPTDATALFGPEDVPARNGATPSSPGPSGYPYATVSYLNPNGKEVNTATPGGHIDTAEYDKFGNTIRTLQATDREIALGTHPKATQYQADLGLTGLSTSARAQALSTTNTYSTDGLDLLTTTGPSMRVVLAEGLADPDSGGPLTAMPAGSTVLARAHTVNVYDENKPDGATYHLLTTTTSGAAIPGYPDAEARTTANAYSAAKGGTSGWTLRKPTTVIADAGAGGAGLTSYVVYDSTGRATESWGIGATGTDARTTKTIFYTAGTNAADAACGNTPKWAGNACVTKKAGAVTGHDPTRMATNLPERRVTSYTRWGDVGVVTETVPGTTASRTTTTTYDTAGRISLVAITSTNDGATALPAISTDYSSTTGQVTATHLNTTGTPTITREYDSLGRLYRYTDADGGATTNEFDRYGKPSKVTDPTGYATYTYNRTLEPRGLLTSTTDSIAGTFSAEYSPDGQLTVLHYPNGMTRTDTLDANLEPIARTYTRDTDNAVIYTDAIVTNSSGEAVSNTYTGGTHTYTYDRIGRLTATAETPDGSGCTTRTYTYDTRTNRTSRKTYNPDTNGACRTTGTVDAQADHIYDTADRTTDTGYTYDPFGRITTMPGGLSNTFYANDRAASQTLDTNRQQWTLDPNNRFRSFTTSTYNGSTWDTTASRLNHYGDDSDSPRWIIEDTGTGTLTRMVSGPDGNLAATTTATGTPLFQVIDLHGDVATTLDATLLPPGFNRYDEYGVPTTGQAQTRYGWLGSKQRSAEALGGVILMGVRLYHPDTGRFLQPDPIDGGSATAYDYCNADPVNTFDLAGTWSWKSALAHSANAISSAATTATNHITAASKAVVKLPWGNIIDTVNTGLSVAALLGCGPCAAASAAISLGRGLYKVAHGDKSGWMDLASAATFGVGKGLKMARDLSKAGKMLSAPKGGLAKEAVKNKRARQEAAQAARKMDRTWIKGADRLDRAYGAATAAYSIGQMGYKKARHGSWF